MIDDLERQLSATSSEFGFIQQTETLLKTPHTLKMKLTVTPACFIQTYHNIRKNIANYTLVLSDKRLFGRDCDGGLWHCHPMEAPDQHDCSEYGAREVTFEEFLVETREKLISLGII